MATKKITPAPLTRSLGAIAQEIGELWPAVKNEGTYDPAFGLQIGQHPANPYWQTMAGLRNLDGHYGSDPATDIVRRFLSNASSFRGERAKAIKLELEGALADHAQPKQGSGVDARRRETMARYRASRVVPTADGLKLVD